MTARGDEVVRRAQEIVRRILYVTLATASPEGRPWNSPVYAAFDDEGCFYWVSAPEAAHSMNIERNHSVALVIYDSTAPEGTGEGVYIEATAHALDDLDIIRDARRHLALRVGNPVTDDNARFAVGGVQRAYRAVPKAVWMNDCDHDAEGNYVRDTRVELPLECLCNLTTWG